jgi:hypothetical protein
MKNVFMYSMFILGTILIIKGVFNFFPFEIKSNVNVSEAYNSGHILGYIVGKFGKIALGVLMLKYGYQTYLEGKIRTE